METNLDEQINQGPNNIQIKRRTMNLDLTKIRMKLKQHVLPVIRVIIHQLISILF